MVTQMNTQIKEVQSMFLNQATAKIYDSIFFFIEYFNPDEIEKHFINCYDDPSFMISCYDQVRSGVGGIPEYLAPLFVFQNKIASPMSEFFSERFGKYDSVDSFILGLVTDSAKLRAKVYETIFGAPETGSYTDALETLNAPLEFKLRAAMLFGDFDHAIKVLVPIFKQVYLSVEELNKKYEREIASRFEQIQSATNVKTYQNFLKYDESLFDSTEISVCLLNQYLVCSTNNDGKALMMLGFRHEEALEKQFDDAHAVSVEQFIICCGNELRMNIIKALNERGELTASQLSQTLDCPVTTTIRHIDYLRNYNLIFMSRREGLQIFYKLNLKLFRKMKIELDSLLDEILSKK